MVTGNGIMVSASAETCTIEFDTSLFNPEKSLIRDTEEKIVDTGLDLWLDCTGFGNGVLTLIIGKIESVGNAIVNIIRFIIGQIKASTI